MSNVNPATVEVLTRVDMQTMKAAMSAQKLSLIRMSDGTHPTALDMDLIKRASRDDLQAAAEHMRRHAELEMERDRRRMEAHNLMVQYARDTSEPAGSVVTRMTPEDRERFMDSMEAFL